MSIQVQLTPPTPDDMTLFVPYACLQLQAPFRVTFDVQLREEYVSKTADSRPKKSTLPQLPSPIQQSDTKEDSASTGTSSQEDSDAYSFNVQAVLDAAGNLVELAIVKYPEVPRLFIKVVALCLPFNPFLHKLILRCGLTGVSLYETVKIMTMTHITEMNLDDSQLPERNYYLLLECPSHLEILSLARCSITDSESTQLFARLEYPQPASKTLKILCLMGNYISDEGALCLGNVLRSNRSLMYINLSGNQISDQGASHILRSLIEFPMTPTEIKNKRKRSMDLLKLRKEVYDRCYLELKNAGPLSDAATDQTSVKRKGLKVVEATSRDMHSPDTLAMKAEKMATELVDTYPEPFRIEETTYKNNLLYSTGNLVLTYLNLAYNNLSYLTVTKLMEVVRYQTMAGRYPNLGLFCVQVEGNAVPACPELDRLSDMMARAVQVRLVYTQPNKGRTVSKARNVRPSTGTA